MNIAKPIKCAGCGEVFPNMGSLGCHGKYSTICTPQMRFWGKVDKTDPGGCWLYKGSLNKDGYATLAYKDKMISGHRMAWIFTHDEIPNGLCVLHKCDVRNCVNPSHLFLGTKKDNAQDKQAKGRFRSRYQPVEELLYPHLSRRGRGGRGKGRKDRHTG